MQKESIRNAKGFVLQCKRGFFALLNDNLGVQRSPFLCFEVTEWLSWTIKNASEISRIRFPFVTISYRQYNICMY